MAALVTINPGLGSFLMSWSNMLSLALAAVSLVPFLSFFEIFFFHFETPHANQEN